MGRITSLATDADDALTVPVELLCEESTQQPVTRDEWEAVLNRTVVPIVNRATLHHAYALGMRSDSVVARRYVHRYIRSLSTVTDGMPSNATEFKQRRGLVCELLWTVPNASKLTWIDFAEAVGFPDCGDWTALPEYIR